MIDYTTLSLMATAWFGLLAAAISPGPNMLACVQRGLASGWQSAVRVAFGISLASIIWVILVMLGLTTLLTLYPEIAPIVSVFGGLYLLYLGFKGFRSIFNQGISSINGTASINPWHDVSFGFLVSISNPKVALFWVSLSSIVGLSLQKPIELVIFALGSSLITFTIYSAYGILFSNTYIRMGYLKYQKLGDFIFGSVFSILGFGLLFYAVKLMGNV